MVRIWIAALLLAQAGCVQTERPALERGAAYLWSRQAEDGGWHSHTYGLLRSGQSLTPFVLDALLQAPDAPRDKVASASGGVLTICQSVAAVFGGAVLFLEPRTAPQESFGSFR